MKSILPVASKWYAGIQLVALILVFFECISGSQVWATESGGSMYPGGNEDFMNGALPPPGKYAMLYTMNYSADALKDDSGDDLPIGFDLNATAIVARFVHVLNKTAFGASIGWHVIVPFVMLDVKIDAAGVDESSSGLGDIEFSPFILGWHLSKNLHMVATVDFMVPTGSYDKTDPSSVGRNYITIDPIYAVTYISDGGFELSGKFQYLINLENSDTDYTSGHEFILDYLIGHHFGPWNIGLNGYIYKQVTDDEQNGSTVSDNKGQCVSVGPAVQYNYKNMFFNLKYQVDTMVENRPEGNKIWFKYMYAF